MEESQCKQIMKRRESMMTHLSLIHLFYLDKINVTDDCQAH
jgi:hypothetical protein